MLKNTISAQKYFFKALKKLFQIGSTEKPHSLVIFFFPYVHEIGEREIIMQT